MKKLIALLLAVVLFSLLFNGCTPEENPQNQEQTDQTEKPDQGGNPDNSDKTEEEAPVTNAQIQLAGSQEEFVVADPSGDTFSIRFMSSDAWKVTALDEPDWLHLTPTEGAAGTGKVNVTVDRNESGEERYAVVEVKAGNTSVQIEIEQDIFVPTFELSMTSKEISAKGGQFVITVSTDSEYYFDIIPEWITSPDTKAISQIEHVFHVEPNPLPEPRTGMITFCSGATCRAVTITQRAAGTEADDWKLDEFKHRSLALRFTADWCGYCPYMATAFSDAKANMGDAFETVSLHGGGSTYDFIGTSTLESRYNITGYPYGVVDGRAGVQNNSSTEVTTSLAQAVAEETQANYPAKTAVACSSTLDGTSLTVNVDLYAKGADTYKLVVLLLEDNIIGYQNGGGNKYEHNDVARLSLTPVLGDEVVVANDFTICSKTYTADIKSSWKAEDLRLLVYIEKPYGDQERVKGVSGVKYLNKETTYVDNCRSFPVGETVEVELK